MQLPTSDGALSTGWLYARGGEDTVACVMHPRGDFSRHYVVPDLLDAGVAVLTQNSRWLGSDATLVHEQLLFDVAAGLAHVRQRFDRVVLVGNSGGGSLYTFYLQQASLPTGQRLVDTAAGDPVALADLDMPHADAMVYLAAHPGEGLFMAHCIDPSVTDESDPTASDPALDPFEPANGFHEPPESSSYEAAFVQAYRSAQLARVARLDALAHERVARRRRARAAYKANGDRAGRRASVATDFLTVYRTDADLRCVDLSLDPSDRDYGSIWGRRPDVINYGAVGFGRLMSPEAWLSTWSGLSSRAAIPRTGPAMTLPALLVEYTGDNAVFPSDQDLIAASLGTTDLTRVRVGADHYGFPAERRREATDVVVEWLQR